MKLQTNLPLTPSQSIIDYNSKVFLVGSCFTEHIGAKLNYFKFQTAINPFGILFHPKAITTFLKAVGEKKIYTEADLVFQNERWHGFDAHSALSSTSEAETLANLNQAITEAHRFIEEATHIIITLGTAWGYRFKATQQTVANCHKIPQQAFDKFLSSPKEIVKDLFDCITSVKVINPACQLVFTVSPVRHLKDGFVENQRSKAHLIAAIHQVVEQTPESTYFPSYEIMMDELRDYRFYAADMVHPSALAIDYIWEKFEEVYLSPQAKKIKEKVAVIQRGLAHWPFNPQAEAHLKFLEKLEQKKEELHKEVPHIVF